MLESTAKNYFWLSLKHLVSRGLRAVVVVLAARLLSPSDWGSFSYALALAGFIAVFADPGVLDLTAREICTAHTHRQRYSAFANGLLLRATLLVLPAPLVAIGYALTAQHKDYRMLTLLLAATWLSGISDVCTFTVRAIRRIELETFAALASGLVTLFASAILLFHFHTPVWLAVAYFVGAGIGLLSYIRKLRPYFLLACRYMRPAAALHMLKQAWCLGVLSIGTVLIPNINILLLGVLVSSSTEVGYYTAAQRLIEVMVMVPGILAASYYPELSRQSFDRSRLREELGAVLSFLLLLAVPVAALGLIFGQQMVTFLFGLEYAPAGTVLVTMSFTVISQSAILLGAYVLFVLRDRGGLIVAFIGGLSVHLPLSFALVPKFGANGSAMATLLYQICSALIIWSKVRKLLHGLPPLFALAVMRMIKLHPGAQRKDI